MEYLNTSMIDFMRCFFQNREKAAEHHGSAERMGEETWDNR